MYADIDTQEQYQDGPGLDANIDDRADLGEETYRGSGRLTGRKALITGGDSGIGARHRDRLRPRGRRRRASSYLPEEEEDAQRIVGLIEEAGPHGRRHPGRPDRRRRTAATSWPRPSRRSAASTSSSTTPASSSTSRT